MKIINYFKKKCTDPDYIEYIDVSCLQKEGSIAKSSKTVMYTRELDIMQLIASGKGSKEISEELAKKHKTTPRSILVQYYSILKKMEQDLLANRNEVRSILLTRADSIYAKALQDDNLKVALEATSTMAKLAGLGEKSEPVSVKPSIVIQEREYKAPTLVKSGTDDTES